MVVDVHLEVSAEGKLEAFAIDVAVAGDKVRELRFRRPGGAAVGRTPVVRIPEGAVSCVHPRNADVAFSARHDGGKRMSAPIRTIRYVGFQRPTRAGGCGR